MSSGYYLTPPFYYFNLGAHTLYILRNRLEAQNVKKSKQIKILEDICSAIFKQNFIQSLLVPQDPFNIPVLKDIFSRLVHSSIMKLDQTSLDKLFYLILMSLKKQLFLLSSPYELYSMTMSHLLNLIKYLHETNVISNLQYAVNQFQKIAGKYSFVQYTEIREYMLSELQTYQTKIVNFIEMDYQTSTGKLVFKIRNGHNQKSLGNAVNQQDIDLSKNMEKYQNQLFYNNWQNWRSSLVIDFVKEYKISSERRHSALTKQSISKKQEQHNNQEKTLKDTLNLHNIDIDVNEYQVTFDLFEKQKNMGQVNDEILQSMMCNKKQEKKQHKKVNNNTFKSKIEKEFSELGIEANNDNQDEELDLLEMMDN